MGEQSIIARAGGADPAVGMAYILHGALGGLMNVAFWYHFAILFEALFILTAGGRRHPGSRFMLQDLMGSSPRPSSGPIPCRPTCSRPPFACWPGATSFIRGGGPLGGIKPLWPLFGIANQMLAGMALMLCAVGAVQDEASGLCLPVALLPTSWLLICTLSAGWEEDFSDNPSSASWPSPNKFQAMIDSGTIPAQYPSPSWPSWCSTTGWMQGLTLFFMAVVVVLAFFSLKTALKALQNPQPTANRSLISRCRRARRLSPTLMTTAIWPQPEVSQQAGTQGAALIGNERGASMFDTLAKAGKYLGQTARLMVGVPITTTMCAAHAADSPRADPMSHDEFFRERQDAAMAARMAGVARRR